MIGGTATFDADDAVEVAGPDGRVFAKGLVAMDAGRAAPRWPGTAPPTSRPTASRRSIHRDDLVVLPGV